MQLSRADMPVEDTFRSEPVHQLAEVLHVGWQQSWRNSRVLNHPHRLRISLHAAEDAEASLAEVPHLAHIIAIYARTFIYLSAL